MRRALNRKRNNPTKMRTNEIKKVMRLFGNLGIFGVLKTVIPFVIFYLT